MKNIFMKRQVMLSLVWALRLNVKYFVFDLSEVFKKSQKTSLHQTESRVDAETAEDFTIQVSPMSQSPAVSAHNQPSLLRHVYLSGDLATQPYKDYYDVMRHDATTHVSSQRSRPDLSNPGQQN